MAKSTASAPAPSPDILGFDEPGPAGDKEEGLDLEAYLDLEESPDITRLVQNLQGAASWLRLQWQEELAHATKLIDYMAERGGGVQLQAIGGPAAAFGSLLDVFEKVLHDEQEVTAAIYRIYDLALQEKDYAAQGLMQWYVQEQVEEENSAQEVVSMLRLAGDSSAGLLMVDRRLAERTAAA